MQTTLAIIGAGIAGLTLARALQTTADVTVFEKSRGLGGRMANRRRDGYAFDHGAQYFTARSDHFQGLVRAAEAAGHVAQWPSRVPTLTVNGLLADRRPQETRYIGAPGMSGLANHLGEGLAIRKEVTVAKIVAEDTRWRLLDDQDGDLGLFDMVLSSAPAPQAARLLPAAFSGHAALGETRMSGCFTLMIGLSADCDLGFQAARIEDDILSWIAVDSSKPQRAGKPALVVHSRNDWAEDNLERDRDSVRQDMLQALAKKTGTDFSMSSWLDLHRWRYASVDKPLGQAFLFDAAHGLGACGDWCLGNRVEAAVESAAALAEAVTLHLARN